MEIEELKLLQMELEITEHLVWMGPLSFTIAHTDEERSEASGGGAPLVDCELHRYLTVEGEAPPTGRIGIYVVRRYEIDPTSQSFRSDASPWIFQWLDPQPW